MARILVIDDEELIRVMVRRILERAGHEVAEADNGAVGVKMYAEAAYDLVLCDVIMPEKDGIETIIELQQMDASVKIIAMSGGGQVSEHSYLRMARVLGATVTLNKPFSRRDLLQLVEDLLSTAAA